MAPEIEINARRIEQHADDLRGEIAGGLKKAGDALNADNVYNLEGGAFSITCTTASMAYPGAVQFAFENLRTYTETVEGFAKTLDTAARNYRGAEQASTVRKV